jgi:glutathionylspermidine synthase
MRDIGWDSRRNVFVDLANRPMETIFKLYPWEWLLEDKFAIQLLQSFDRTTWIEPIWKMLLSNKGILPILWEIYPGHRYLLPAYFDGPHEMTSYVKKPILGREGGNVTIVSSGSESGQDLGYGAEGYIYQEYFELPTLEGMHPIIGSWVIDGVSRGIGVRESAKRITDPLSSFVPHLFC